MHSWIDNKLFFYWPESLPFKSSKELEIFNITWERLNKVFIFLSSGWFSLILNSLFHLTPNIKKLLLMAAKRLKKAIFEMAPMSFPCNGHLLFCESWEITDLQALYISGTYCQWSGTRPRSCNMHREPTKFTVFWTTLDVTNNNKF